MMKKRCRLAFSLFTALLAIAAPHQAWGTTGILTIDGNYTQNSGSIDLRIGGLARGTDYDAVVVTGDVTINGGDLNVTLINGFVPVALNSFDLLDFSTWTGEFDNVNLPTNVAWDTSQLTTTGVLSVFTALPGDYNNDRIVNAADFTVWRDHLGAPAGAFPNDVDGGTIDSDQYETWKANFGATPGSGALTVAAAAVPEPAGVGLIALAVLAVLARRWH